MRDDRGFQTGELAERVDDRLPRDAHTEIPRDHLVPDKPLSVVHLPPGEENGVPEGCLIVILQQQEPLLHHGPQPQGARHPVGRRKQQCDRLGHIAHRLIALVEKPIRDACLRGGPFFEFYRGDRALDFVADKKAEGPGRVVGRRRGKVTLQRLDLARGLRRLVEGEIKVGKPLHKTPG